MYCRLIRKQNLNSRHFDDIFPASLCDFLPFQSTVVCLLLWLSPFPFRNSYSFVKTEPIIFPIGFLSSFIEAITIFCIFMGSSIRLTFFSHIYYLQRISGFHFAFMHKFTSIIFFFLKRSFRDLDIAGNLSLSIDHILTDCFIYIYIYIYIYI